jgi:hypothetical protein
VPRHTLSADGNLDIGVGRVELEQAWEDLVVLNVLAIEAHRVAGSDPNGDEVLGGIRGRNVCRWQCDLDSLHVSLAQAHHHETREQKEHDVDQWNDLDPGVFLWNG